MTPGSSEPVDLKEIFVYSLLNYIGYGQEVHFFCDSFVPSAFYIATKDASQENHRFKTYEKLKADGLYNQSLEDVDEGIASGLEMIDLLFRILALTDLPKNTDKFEFVSGPEHNKAYRSLDNVLNKGEVTTRYQPKILNFRVKG